MDGWIKLHRKVMKSPMYRQLNSKQRDVMMTILLLANHESNTWEFRGEVYEVQPGQFITSLDSLKENCASDVTTQNIRTALLKLEKHGFLTNESTKKNRLITVVNWGLYQGCGDTTNKEINRQPTNSQQTANNQLTTNKNDKNLKNEKKDKKKEYTPDFESFWNIYPRKIGKQEAFKTWNTVLKRGEDPQLIIQCAENYKAQCDRLKTDQQYIKHPKTFLNEERYKDYQEGGGVFGKHEGHNDRPTSQSKFASADKNKPFDPSELEKLGIT